jgi:hypothetical protein
MHRLCTRFGAERERFEVISLFIRIRENAGTRGERDETEGLDDACIRCLIAEPFFRVIHSSPPTSHFSALPSPDPLHACRPDT